MMTLGPPQCVPVITRDHLHQNDSHPEYLVLPGDLVGCVKRDDLHVKIIDFGEGSSSHSRSSCWTLNFFVAFFSGEVPPNLHTPLQVRAPEVIFNDLSTLLKVEYGTRVDVWSIGCLVWATGQRGSIRLTL